MYQRIQAPLRRGDIKKSAVNDRAGHGPDQASWRGATNAELKPHKIENTLAFMFETRWPVQPTRWALESPTMQLDYDDVWTGFDKARPPR